MRDLDILQYLFLPRDVDLIQSIPLSSSQGEDMLFWPYTQLDSYFVKSGYRFLSNIQSCDTSVPPLVNNDLWKKVWGLSVQPKVRNFLWRAIKTPFLQNPTSKGVE